MAANSVELLNSGNPSLKHLALRSLTHLTNEVPHSVLYCIDENSFKLVRKCSLIDDSLIKEEVLVIKTFVDYGKPMRLQAFLLLETALDKCTNQAFELLGLHPQILQAALDRIRTLPIDADDEKEFPMVLTRLSLIRGLTAVSPRVLSAESSRFKHAIEPYLSRLDPDSRQAKNFLGTFYSVYLNTKRDFNIEVEELFQIARGRPELKDLLQQIEKEYD